MTYAGYSDWYLPASDTVGSGSGELNSVLYANKTALGGFASALYWSSTDVSSGDYAWLQNFSNGFQYGDFAKAGTRQVRCVRRW